MKLSPTLSTERLTLEPLRAGNAAEAWPYVDDPAMWTYFPELRPASVDDLRKQWRKWEAGSPEPDEIWLNWACRHKSGGNIIGTMQATVYRASSEAYIAYSVYRPYQGNGYAREASIAVIEHLRESYRVKKIYAEMNAGNEASYKLAESLGFERIETGENYLYVLY